MKALTRSPIESSRGQTVVEFALILLLLFAVVMAILEFSIVMYNKALITNACREGARAGSLFRVNADGTADPWTQARIDQVVNDYLQDQLVTFGTPSTPTVTATWHGTPPSAGGTDGRVEVTVNFTYTYLTLPRLLNFGGGTLDLTAFSVMTTE